MASITDPATSRIRASSIPAVRRTKPPRLGFWRGFCVLALTMIILLVVLVLALLATNLGLIPVSYGITAPPSGAPYSYLVTGQPEADAHALLLAIRSIAFQLISNGVLLLAIFALSLWLLTKQKLRPLLGPTKGFKRDIRCALLLLVPFYGLLTAYYVTQSEINPMIWITVHPVAAGLIILALPIQTLTEEIIFRGFIQRWLGGLTGSAVLAAWLQSGLFALLHPDQFVLIFVLGMAATTLTIGTGNLGAGWMLHLLNNGFVTAMGFLPATEAGVLPGFSAPNPLPFGLIPTAFASVGLMLIYALVLRRREAAGETLPA